MLSFFVLSSGVLSELEVRAKIVIIEESQTFCAAVEWQPHRISSQLSLIEN